MQHLWLLLLLPYRVGQGSLHIGSIGVWGILLPFEEVSYLLNSRTQVGDLAGFHMRAFKKEEQLPITILLLVLRRIWGSHSHAVSQGGVSVKGQRGC